MRHAARPETAAEPGDDEILELVARGRHRAFDLLVERYGARVRRYISQTVGAGAPADDLTQDVFVRVFKEAGAGRQVGSFAAWLYRVARHRAVDYIRRERAHRRAIRTVEASGANSRSPASPLALLEAREFAQRLDQALEELPESFRTAFLLREQEGLSYEEIGEVLDISPKTVSTRIHRARLKLRGLLQPWLDGRPERPTDE